MTMPKSPVNTGTGFELARELNQKKDQVERLKTSLAQAEHERDEFKNALTDLVNRLNAPVGWKQFPRDAVEWIVGEFKQLAADCADFRLLASEDNRAISKLNAAQDELAAQRTAVEQLALNCSDLVERLDAAQIVVDVARRTALADPNGSLARALAEYDRIAQTPEPVLEMAA